MSAKRYQFDLLCRVDAMQVGEKALHQRTRGCLTRAILIVAGENAPRVKGIAR